MSVTDALLSEFDEEMANTRRVLERCADEKFGWKPHQKSWDLATLATHVANMPGWAADTIKRDEFDVAPPGASPYQESVATSRQDLLARFDKNVGEAHAALAQTDGAHLEKDWSLLAGGQTLFKLSRAIVFRKFVLNHLIHHRGQLCVYLRLNDIPVPALYGPSADETGM